MPIGCITFLLHVWWKMLRMAYQTPLLHHEHCCFIFIWEYLALTECRLLLKPVLGGVRSVVVQLFLMN